MTKQEIKQLRSYIKTANQRIVALEKGGYTKTSKAYRYITETMPERRDIITTSSSGHVKFITSLSKLSDEELESLNKRVRGFLEKKTTTKLGNERFINETIKNLENKLKEAGKNEDVELTKDDVSNFWNKIEEYKERSLLSSDQALELASENDYEDISKFLNAINPDEIKDYSMLKDIIEKQREVVNDTAGTFEDIGADDFIDLFNKNGYKSSIEIINDAKRK